ncbi:hypothetical protein LF1_56870 [Rubripirellula obstinata]|uniref:Uncharacterized protein n=1 Tax=Rubripirellula obstinata TaxID=406547 RepID=A0A5B1CBM7_9BACT|nr:hypothetical protein LF1_56870 [Rubripirellula obstinata]
MMIAVRLPDLDGKLGHSFLATALLILSLVVASS